VLRHACDIVGKGGSLVAGLSRIETEKLREILTVLRIFVDSELDVLAESTVELVELFAILGNLIEELKGLLDNVLLDDLHNLVLLKSFTRQVERKILRINNAFDEAQPLGNKVGSIVCDEDTADI